jgi:hypothetical protein
MGSERDLLTMSGARLLTSYIVVSLGLSRSGSDFSLVNDSSMR